MRATVLEKLRAVAAARAGTVTAADAHAQPAPVPEPQPTPEPAPRAIAGEQPLPAAVRFHVPGAGDVWLLPTARDAERLGIPRGQWLTPADMILLEPLSHTERIEVLRWMRATGGVLAAAPKPASRRPAPRRPERKASAGVALPEDLRLQAEALGWCPEHLERLASLLHPGDRIGEVTAVSIEIIRRSGVVQHFYHPEAAQPWRKRAEDGASD